MNKWADLHVHTSFSDGSFSPRWIVREAKRLGLSIVGITDHDCVFGIEEAKVEGENLEVEVIPGIELSVEEYEKEVHMLGYFVDWHNKQLREVLSRLSEVRLERAKKMVELLNEMGMEISFSEVLKQAKGNILGRLHIAQVMRDKGWVASIEEAFQKYIGEGKPAYVKKYRLTFGEAVSLIEGVGGIPVLAHPGLLGRDELIGEFAEKGLKGIEVYYPNQDAERYFNIARKFNLLMTGGSDYHGPDKEHNALGCIKIPGELAIKLKEFKQRKLCEG